MLLYNSKCLIGNSSVGVRECAYLGVPVINIGTRQNGRERGKNIIDVGYHKDEILAAAQQQIQHGRYAPDLIYGDGKAGEQIAALLSTLTPAINKKITY